ncbi:MAG: DNA-dependent RNA polymerase auxiliary subunit epsilon family protein [Streptococcaceae bacterium]|jgi:DNA-dependent RNA polymerase auxiliary subunit epsilon|nr:DNA-dependent RNA polymerase auxiliary subunit epsilon family protein [Streptococcaceae bacterium]
MIYKVFYQNHKGRNPKREQTQTLYIESDTEIEARDRIEKNSDFNIEYLQALTGNHLEYEKESANFSLVNY